MSAPVLITGGSGFIGCNLADALAKRGERVIVLDSLARGGAQENARWLTTRHGGRIDIVVADIRDAEEVRAAVGRASAVLHLAAQVAVTTSLAAPAEDFDVNARGTLNVLEAVRLTNRRAPVLFASTNKVYGRLLPDASIGRNGQRYRPFDTALANGVSEKAALDLYSPYGCSKGAADQYVHDYARVFGLRTAVLRMSCIYGPRQFGTEDQGWMAHFLRQAIRGEPVTIYGDGLQVRDALHVSDAVAAWLGLLDHIDAVDGRIFNLGGGPGNSLSLLDLLDLIAELRGEVPDVRFDSWRPGDQPWYVSDIRALAAAIGWRPRMSDCARACAASTIGWRAASHRARRHVPRSQQPNGCRYESGADQPELALRRQYLFRMPLAASAAGIAHRAADAGRSRPQDVLLDAHLFGLGHSDIAAALSRLPSGYGHHHDSADLSVLALRSARTAGAAAIDRGPFATTCRI